jgi:hypothetical protein
VELEVQCDVIGRTVVKIVKTVSEMEQRLNKVVTWAEGKYGVQRSYSASSCGEVEEVTISVLGEASVRGFGELSLENVLMGIIPSTYEVRNGRMVLSDDSPAVRSPDVDRFTNEPCEGIEQNAQKNEGFCLEHCVMTGELIFEYKAN